MQIGFIGRRCSLSKEHKEILRYIIRRLCMLNDVERFHFADVKGANNDAHDVMLAINYDYSMFDNPISLYSHPTLCASERAYCTAAFVYPARDNLGTVFKDIADFSDILIIESEEDFQKITEYAKKQKGDILFLPNKRGEG